MVSIIGVVNVLHILELCYEYVIELSSDIELKRRGTKGDLDAATRRSERRCKSLHSTRTHTNTQTLETAIILKR
jgi:hypothetical protein